MGALVVFLALTGGYLTYDTVSAPNDCSWCDSQEYSKENSYEYMPEEYHEKGHKIAYLEDRYQGYGHTPKFPLHRDQVRRRFKRRLKPRYYTTSRDDYDFCDDEGCFRNRFERPREVAGHPWEIRYDPWKGEPIMDDNTHRFITQLVYDDQRGVIKMVGHYDPRSGFPLEYEGRRGY
jgi:hypothetical protein